jgi:hypothetical protein
MGINNRSALDFDIEDILDEVTPGVKAAPPRTAPAFWGKWGPTLIICAVVMTCTASLWTLSSDNGRRIVQIKHAVNVCGVGE